MNSNFSVPNARLISGLVIIICSLAQAHVKISWGSTNVRYFNALIKVTRPIASAVKIKFPSLLFEDSAYLGATRTGVIFTWAVNISFIKEKKNDIKVQWIFSAPPMPTTHFFSPPPSSLPPPPLYCQFIYSIIARTAQCIISSLEKLYCDNLKM